MAVLLPVEGDCWQIVLAGRSGANSVVHILRCYESI